MTAQQHALARLRLALETGRWEFVKDAYEILDGVVNGQVEKPVAIQHPRKRAA